MNICIPVEQMKPVWLLDFQGHQKSWALLASLQTVRLSCSSDLLCSIPEGHPEDEQWQRTKLVSGSQAFPSHLSQP